MMDNCCAPQWADFMHSPQVLCDDYFERVHEVHEPQVNLGCIKRTDLPTPCKNGYENSMNGTRFEDSLEETADTKVAYFIPLDSKKAMDDARKENRLRDLKLNEKSNKVHQTWSISITELTSTFKVSTAEDKNKPMLPERIRKRLMEPKRINAKNVKKDDAKEQTENDVPPERLSYKIVAKRQSGLFKKQRSIGKSNQPKVLTCQYRRRSLLNRRCSNKFISFAEAVSRYQNGTPQRFRTLSNKSGFRLSKRLKHPPMKLTRPVSPTLRCKKRTRQTTVLSQEEREKLQVEELKKNPIKANPVPVSILSRPSTLKKVPKKPPTVAEEFHLSQPKKKDSNDQEDAGPVTRSASAANALETKDIAEPISKRTRQTIHAIVQEKLINKEQKSAPVTRSANSSNAAAKKNACTDSPGKKTRHTLHASVQENKKEPKAPITRSTSASNVITAKKENSRAESAVKKSRDISPVNLQENKKEQKVSAPIDRPTSASNVIAKENSRVESSVKKSRAVTPHANLQENKKEQKNSAPTGTSNVTVRKNAADLFNRKTRHTSVHAKTEESNEKKSAAPITRSISASSIKKTNVGTAAKKSQRATLHASMQENKEKKEVPILRSVSASSIRTEHKNAESLRCNFEARNKVFQAKKEEKLKCLQEMSKVKAEFHARPAPKFARSALAAKEPKKEPAITTCPFSFEQRNKALAKKKEEFVKQKHEQETKSWVFHANPAPKFKPVTVNGSSKESLRSKEKEPAKRPKGCNDQENRQPNVMKTETKKSINKIENKPVKMNGDAESKDKSNPKKVPKFELKTDKRAKDRTEFDEKLKLKEQEMAMKKAEQEKNRLLHEKMQIAELRKMMEIKARPMPVYKSLAAIKSAKPLTSPHSPALGVRSRAKSAS